MPVITSARFAAATSVVALVAAMGGTGYAAVKIHGNQIAKNAITSKHVKNDSLQGKDIKESTLGKVPSASTADTATNATNATNAGKVNGVTLAKVFYRSPAATPTVIFSGGGLSITAVCNSNVLALTATTSKQDSSIYSSLDDVEADLVDGNDQESQAFDTTSNFDLLSGATPAEEDPSIITFVYDAQDGTVITGMLSTDIGAGPGLNQCSVTGTVSQG